MVSSSWSLPFHSSRREGPGKRDTRLVRLLVSTRRMAKTEDRAGAAPPPPGEVTRLLLAWRRGDQEALERLIPLVYEELHRMAERYLRRERRGHTLQPTAIVNEAYLRLLGRRSSDWQNRA